MTELTDEQCAEFRRLPISFNDMVRAIHKAGRESMREEAWQPIETAPKDGTEILVSNGRTCAAVY